MQEFSDEVGEVLQELSSENCFELGMDTTDNPQNNTVDGCEIRHQLIDGLSHDFVWVSTIRLVVQDFATIHSMIKKIC